MDPNQTLADLRAALDKADDDIVVEDIADLFAGLDAWLSRGGFLPDAWGRAQ